MTFHWEANPIVVREGRARWRGHRAFVVALIYSVLLAVVMGFSYANAGVGDSDFGNAAQRSHELFQTLTLLQTGAWLLLAPALTATSIVGEREGGLLPSLLLSRLTPSEIIGGKLLSALSFIALLIVVALPILAMCFLMGGVSPSEFLGATALHFSTALCGAAIGIAASCTHRRGTAAISAAFGFVVLWFISSGTIFLTFTNLRISPAMRPWWAFAAELYGWSNPMLAALDLTSPDGWATAIRSRSALSAQWSGWLWCVLFQCALTALRLWQSVRVLKRPFDTLAEPLSARKPRRPARTQTSTQASPEPTFNVQNRDAARLSSDWMQWPGTQVFIRGSAAMQRELTSRWRLRRPTTLVWWLAMIPSVALLYLGVRVLWWSWHDSNNGRDFFMWSSALWLLASVTVCALMGASSISRERENGTWSSLRLSLLSAHDIVRAKTLSPLLVFLWFSAPLLLMWLLLVVEYGVTARQFLTYDFTAGLSPLTFLAMLALVLSAGWWSACWGVWCSQKMKTTANAVGWSLGGLFLLWAVLPLLLTMMLPYQSNTDIGNSAFYWNPFFALIELLGTVDSWQQDGRVQTGIYHVVQGAACFTAFGWALRFATWRALQNENRR